MLPKIIFRYSWIYDQIWRDIRKNRKDYPSIKKVLNYRLKAEKIWKKEGNKILTEIEKITHLKWRAKIIICYVVGNSRPFSDPLTIPFYKKTTRFLDTLTHELIHNIFVQNFDRTEKCWNFFFSKYKKESRTTNIHVPLHAIHTRILLNLYGKNRLKEEIEWAGNFIKKYPDYKRSWEIVNKDGHQNIIKEFVKRIK